MTVHLIKLAAGLTDFASIVKRLQSYAVDDARIGLMVPVFTRNTPKRKDELLDGGSIYWVAGGMLVGRSLFKAIRAQNDDGGRAYCELCVAPEVIRVQAAPKRAFQGWRYLSAADAPADIGIDESLIENAPEDMLNELQVLGLL